MSALDLRALAVERPVHFVGMGGAGMCALAELLIRSGGRVSGCDVKESRSLRDVAELGGTAYVGHDADHVRGASAVIFTAALPSDHPELLAAREAGIPVMKRAEALGAWVNAGTVIAIAGTHGKTTTTAMTTEILADAGRDPTGIVGGRVTGWDGNLRYGSSELYVVEADEYDRSFLTLTPDVAVVTNLEADHLDIYGDLEGVRGGFADFLAGMRSRGRVIVCADDHGASSLLPAVGPAGYTYGTNAGSMLRATDVRVGAGATRCAVHEDGARVGELRLAAGGRHNLLNALGAAAAARALDVPWSSIVAGLEDFSGVGRRFERVGEARQITIFDDYAHHPTEIIAALTALRAMHPDRRLVVAFQPHLYSRTRDFAREFGEALALADTVWVTDVFPAREKPIPGITGETVLEAARAAGARDVHYEGSLEALPIAMAHALEGGEVVVTLGAGSIEVTGKALLARLEEAVHA
jgi:UDP-N-acetylmuramate--alanine ligase